MSCLPNNKSTASCPRSPAPTDTNVHPVLSDNVNHGCQRHATVKRRSRSAKHFYLFDFSQANTIIRRNSIRDVTVQALPILHNQYVFLSGRIDSPHSQIHLFIGRQTGYAGNISNQYVTQASGMNSPNHLLCNQSDRYRSFFRSLHLLRSRDQGYFSLPVLPDHVRKTFRIL